MVFSHNSPYVDKLREPSRLFSFFDRAIETEVNLTIIQQWAEGGHGGTDIGFGASVYDCSFLLSYYVNQHPELVKGKKVVELGCGPGLASLVAGLSGASKVIATDGDPISVALTQKNIETNQLGCDISAMKLYWSNKGILFHIFHTITVDVPSLSFTHTHNIYTHSHIHKHFHT